MHTAFSAFLIVLFAQTTATGHAVPISRGESPVAVVTADAQDSRATQAEKTFAEGEQLRREETAAARRKAIEKYEQALSLWRAIGDRRNEARTLNNLGLVHQALSEYQKALEFYSQALPLRRLTGDVAGEVETTANIAGAYHLTGDNQKAVEYFQQALARLRASGQRESEAEILKNLGITYWNIGDNQQALEHYNLALPLFRAAGNKQGEAETLGSLGTLYDSTGDRRKALDYFNQALSLHREVGYRSGEANTLYNIGLAYDNLSEREKALDYYQQALALFRLTGDQGGEADTLTSLGGVYNDLGEKQKALELFNQAMVLNRATGARSSEAVTLDNIGSLYDSQGEYQKALDYYGQALLLRRTTDDRMGEGATLNNIGLLYWRLGEPMQALEYYRQALLLRRATQDRGGEAATLSNIGLAYRSLDDQAGALDHFNQALQIGREIEDRASVAITMHNIALIHVAAGEHEKALDFFRQVLQFDRDIGNRRGLAHTLSTTGRVYADLKQYAKAAEHFNEALPLSRAVGDREVEVVTLYGLARIAREQEKLDDAQARIEDALEIVESLRAGVGAESLRASYLAGKQNLYEFYADLLMQRDRSQSGQGYEAKALQVVERARARSLLDMLGRSRAEIRQGVAPQLLEQEHSIRNHLTAGLDQLARLLSGKPTPEQKAAAEKRVNLLIEQYQKIQTEIRRASPRYAALTQPQPITVAEIQKQVLDDDTLLLEYALGEQRSYLWVVSPSSISSHQLPPRAEIEIAARKVYDLLIARPAKQGPPDSQFIAQASALSRMLLGAASSQLSNKRLVIVAPGALAYLPFAALPVPAAGNQSSDNYQPLIAEHEVINLPSASVLSVIRRETAGRQKAAKSVAVLADPVFEANDARVALARNKSSIKERQTTSAQPVPAAELTALTRSIRTMNLSSARAGLTRLLFSREEAEAIYSLVSGGAGLKATDFKASRTTATSNELSQHRIVHFATHGLLNSKHPELSGLVFSLIDETGQPQEGFLRLHEIYNLKLPAELVVLSACQTGLGKEIKGEGLVGLTRGFMYAGAPRVVASLWQVDDLATAELMKQFYKRVLKDGMRPAAALREAQVEMSKQKRWAGPYYWAAFVLQGEWK
ncbi:MAG: tetratricopeptide repeat protein [Acidobacteria bacterium]|nr:tetratricopeptide repeat protein [Acidobacteriota bacterium]